MLIERGADVTAQNEDREDSVTSDITVRFGEVEIACMIIERAADVAVQDMEEANP